MQDILFVIQSALFVKQINQNTFFSAFMATLWENDPGSAQDGRNVEPCHYNDQNREAHLVLVYLCTNNQLYTRSLQTDQETYDIQWVCIS